MEPVRYPKGSNAMALLSTILVDGGGRVSRQLRFRGQAIRHPLVFLWSLSLRRWAERSVILLVMQSLDNSIRVRLKSGLFGTRLTSTQDELTPNPNYIPIANEAARVAARTIGGEPTGAINEVLLDVPTTAQGHRLMEHAGSNIWTFLIRCGRLNPTRCRGGRHPGLDNRVPGWSAPWVIDYSAR
jgi:cholesterol oxidase